MPCNSEYLNPTHREAQLQRTAKLYLWAFDAMGLVGLRDQRIKKAAKDQYAGDFGQVEALCGLIRSMTKDQMDNIVYNGRNKTSRDLANWWEEHEKADREREKKEKKATRKSEVKLLSDDLIENDYGWVCYNGGPGSIFWSANRETLEHELSENIRPATDYEKMLFAKIGKPSVTGGFEEEFPVVMRVDHDH